MIVWLNLVENKTWLTQDIVRRLASKSEYATTLVTLVPALYLKMITNTRQKLADSFSKGTFQLSLPQ